MIVEFGAHSPGCLPSRVVADQEEKWERRGDRKNRWTIYYKGPAGSMSRALISSQTSGLTRLVIFDYQPANREGR